MEKHGRLDTLDHRPPNERGLFLLGVWMRLSFIGAAFAIGGVASMIDPPQGVPFVTALTWVVAGATFAWLACQRTVALLDRIDGDEPTQSRRDNASTKRPIARVTASS